MIVNHDLLKRPPRFSSTDYAFNWRELEKYLQKLYLLLGYVNNSESYNIPEEIKNIDKEMKILTYDSISNDISPYEDDLQKLILFNADRVDPTHEDRIATLEYNFGEMMEQLDEISEKIDGLNDTFNGVLVELRVMSTILNEGLNTKEDIDTLRKDEEDDI